MTTLRQIAQVANQGSVCLRSLANANKIQPCLRNVIQHLTVKTFSAQVTTPSPEALGGSVSLTIRGDGSYDLTVHLHDSGLPDYSFRLVGVAASAVLFKTRKLHEDEIAEADKVFLGTVPYDAVTVCNASGPNGNCFAAPGPTGNYLIGANQWFDSLVADDTSKHTLIHELTHVWQMAHTPFKSFISCDAIITSIDVQTQDSTKVYFYYNFYVPGKPWDSYNTEQQAQIVADWWVATQCGEKSQDVSYTIAFGTQNEDYIDSVIRAVKP